jgi:hypothetical protein
MFTITAVSIENNVLVSTVTLQMDDGEPLVVTVPVKLPKDANTVLSAIATRESLEKAKYNAAPLLEPIKAELEAKVMGKMQDASALVKE